MLAPTVAAISMQSSGGGVATVARLLWSVIEQQWGDAARLLVLSERNRQPTFSEKTRYALRLAAVQATGATDWVVYSHLGLAKPLGGMPRGWHKPYAIFLHGIEVWRPLTAGERAVLTNAQLRIANSHFTATRTMAMHPDIGPVIACRLALPTIDAPHSDGVELPWQLGPHAVLTVGRMLESERYKGHDQLIDAWPEVVAAVPDAQLIIAGDGDDVPRLREKAARSSAAGSIVFTGFVSEAVLSALYERAALFALPSRGEGFGLVYLEAMTHRLACIGSIHDAAGEVIADGQTGRLVDLDRPHDLAETIVELLLDEPRRRAMGEAGHTRAATEFAFEHFSRRFRALLVDGRHVQPPA
jgi:phosphatidylinositol alpha-1,6-mannosyltransferase